MLLKKITNIFAILFLINSSISAMEPNSQEQEEIQNNISEQDKKDIKKFKTSVSDFIKNIQNEKTDKKELLESLTEIIQKPILYKKIARKLNYNLDNIEKYINFNKLQIKIKTIISDVDKNKKVDTEVNNAAIKIAKEIAKNISVALTNEKFLEELNCDLEKIKENFDLDKIRNLLTKLFDDEEVTVDEVTEAINEDNMQFLAASFVFIRNYFNMTKIVSLLNTYRTLNKKTTINKFKLLEIFDFKSFEETIGLPLGLLLFYFNPEIANPQYDFKSPSLDEFKKMFMPELLNQKNGSEKTVSNKVEEVSTLTKIKNKALIVANKPLDVVGSTLNNKLNDNQKETLKGSLFAFWLISSGWLMSHGTFFHSLAQYFEPQGVLAGTAAIATLATGALAYKYIFKEPSIEKNIKLNVVQRKLIMTLIDFFESLEKKK